MLATRAVVDASGAKNRTAEPALNRAVVALSSSRLAEAIGNGFVVVAIPATVAVLPHPGIELDESLRVGLTVSLFGLVLSLAQPMAGRLASRWRADRLLLGIGLGAGAAATAAMALATTYWHLLALRTIQGIFMALVVPCTLALIAAWASPIHRGTAMGVYGMARMLGFGIGPMLGGAVLHWHMGGPAYLVATAPTLVALGIVWVAVPRGSPARPVSGGHPSSRGPGPAVDPGLKDFLALSFALFVSGCSLSVMAVLENQFIRRLGQTHFEFGVAFAALVLIRIFADPWAGRISDRIGRKRLIVPGMWLLGPLTVLMAYAPSTLALTAVRLTMGLAMAGISAPVFALAADKAPEHLLAARMSWVTAGFSMGLAVGPLITGALDAYVGFEAPFWAFGSLCVLGAVALQILVREPRRT